MDRALVERKLESLERCMSRIASKNPVSSSELAEDYDSQDIIAVNLERAVQSCLDIAVHLLATGRLPLPSSSAEAFRNLATEGILPQPLAERMAMAVGLRNPAVHEYSRLDWEQIHDYLPRALADLREFAASVSGRL